MGFVFGVVVGIIVGLAIIIAFVRSENSRSARRSQLATTIAAFARMTVEDSRKLLPSQLYPSWVVFSNRQKLTWLNSHLTKIWPYVNEAASELIKTSAEPILEEYRPMVLSALKFSKFTLGTVAPQFTGVSIIEDGGDGVTMELEVQWDGNPSIILDIKTLVGLALPVQVKNVGFTGVFRLIFKPLVNEFPGFGAVCYSLRQKKKLDFTLKVIGGDISTIPGLYDAIEGAIRDAVEDSITWPVRKIVPILPGDYSDLELKPVGILEVKLVQAKELTNKDIIGKSDPYAVLYVRPLRNRTKKSKTINNDLNPIWNEHFEFIVEDASTQHLFVKLYDDEGLQSSELIGCTDIKLSELEPGKVKDVWLKLVKDLEIQRDNKNRGQVHLELLYCPYGTENSFTNPFARNYSMTSLEKVLKGSTNGIDSNGNESDAAQRKKEVIIRGVLSVTVISAEDLPAVDFMGKSDPFVVLTLKKAETKNKTRVVNNSLNPVWNQTFDFVVEDGLHDMLLVEVYDHDTFGKDYMGRVILTLTRACMRTRARYSLEGFSLDELETFLQETDDEDDVQNVDDEEEYKKFLAAVLQGGEGDGHSSHENENLDDDDEDNDADFELELQELLDSDADENAAVETRNECDSAGRRPKTRQNNRRKSSSQSERKTFGQVNRPLRPILPCWLSGQLVSGNGLVPEATRSIQSSASRNGLVNGFTPQQIGQLYSLMHEHVQLLIQVFSLSVLEPSHKQVASQVQSMLFEMLHKRDAVLASTRTPYPAVCFTPSVPGQSHTGSTSIQDAMSMRIPQSHLTSSEGLNGQRSCFQDADGSFWFPIVRGPVLSILDVAPLNLLRGYVNDINSAAREFRKRFIESGFDQVIEKEPLFPFLSSVAGANSTVSSSPDKKQPKKTLAGMLVESSKKQSIALVPKEVASTTQRFLAFFNPALFPHKPPLAASVNRTLFTDSEDELLALGILEYNTDWEAIKQRFLPSKSTHQIFVRQKNRCSSKSSENPIKAVRRMKTSPLTEEEIACIDDGLKHYKSDWMSVWQYIVPHRDPFLLPRQWRVARGTQKSYKVADGKKEKRRLYESERRKSKATETECGQPRSDKEDCEAEIADAMDYSDVPYVHQAFLADWRPDTSTLNHSEHISSASVEVNLGRDSISQDSQLYRGINNYGLSGNVQHQNGNQPAFPSVSKLPLPFHSTSDFRSGMKGAPSATIPKNPFLGATSSSKYCFRPYRSRRPNSAHLVKLAPGLPPVNLPPSVRVVSQTAFKGFETGTSKIDPCLDGVTDVRKDNSASQIPHGEKIGIDYRAKRARPMPKDSGVHSQLESSETAEGRSTVAEKSTYADLQMHPLLFQVTEVGNTPYYPFKFNSDPSSSFSFFSGRQPQLNLSLFSSSQQQGHVDSANKSLQSKNSSLRLGGIDFHPLLQKSNDTQAPTGSDAIQAVPLVNSAVPDTTNISSGLYDKSNELDLEIHLSSVSESEKSMKSRQLKEQVPIESQQIIASRATEMNAPYCQQGSRIPSPSGCKLASSAPLVVPDDNITRYDDVGDQSHPEIVMEQEELSDSEEDIEEHVEFECDEMADSEGEDGSGCEQASEVQNKFECEEMSDSEEEDGSGCEQAPEVPNEEVPRANSDIQLDSCLPTTDAMPNMTLISKEMDDKSNSSWLSLDLCLDLSLDSSRFKNLVPSKAMLQQVTTGEDSASKNFSIGKAVMGEGHSEDIVQSPSIGPRVCRPRKPRKRRSELNTNK